MKNKIALIAAFFAASSFTFAKVSLTESGNVSAEGFIDSSYSHADDDNNAVGGPADSDNTNSFQVDQVEITFFFDYGVVTAQVDLEWTPNGNTQFDQAFSTYDMGNGFAVTAGYYDSMLGFEAFEAPGLYQCSTAYGSNTDAFSKPNANLDTFGNRTLSTNISGLISPGTNNGVKVTYEDGTQFFGISVQDGGLFGDNRLGGDSAGGNAGNLDQITNTIVDETSGYAIEAGYARDLGNGFNVFVGLLLEETECDENDGGPGGTTDAETSVDTTIFNGYVTYETGAWLFAAEVIQSELEVSGVQNDIEIDSFLLMANYTYSAQASVTARISNVDVDDFFDATKLTAAHLYAFTDNLALCVEISSVDYDYEDLAIGTDGDTLEGCVELLFTW